MQREAGVPEVEPVEALEERVPQRSRGLEHVVVRVLQRARAPTGLLLELQQHGRQRATLQTVPRPVTLAIGLRPEILPGLGPRLVRAAIGHRPARLLQVGRVPEEAHSAEPAAAVVRRQRPAAAAAPVVAPVVSVVAAAVDGAGEAVEGDDDEPETDCLLFISYETLQIFFSLGGISVYRNPQFLPRAGDPRWPDSGRPRCDSGQDFSHTRSSG
jgi:hypothetical protein